MSRFGPFLLLLCSAAWGDDARLDALRSSLTSMRGVPADIAVGPRGATPQLTVAKHALRDWMEGGLATLKQQGDVSEFERQLNSQLREAGLFCGETTQPCPDETFLGFLHNLKLRRSGVFLIAQTPVGIACGYDESAYVYSWSGDGWRRVWESEQNAYTDKGYKPQTIHSVQISPYNRANDYLVLTLGSESWCSSSLHDVYYRAFRLGPDVLAAPLVDGGEWARIDDDPPIRGSVTQNDILVEFTVQRVGLGALAHTAVRHYRIDDGGVKRVDPLALRPRDFVDEWLVSEWKESAFWSESANRGSMRDAHSKLRKDHVGGESIFPTMHCKTPDLWQVGVDFSDPPTPLDAPPNKAAYFLVRWRPPYQFRMVQVSDRPSPECVEEDRAADEEERTMFPAREQH